MPTVAAIERYLRTGDHDPHIPGWSGDVVERERRAHHDLKRALVDDVALRTAGRRSLLELDVDQEPALRRERERAQAPLEAGIACVALRKPSSGLPSERLARG